MAKKKKKLGKHNPQKNKPARKKGKKINLGQSPVVTRITFNQPRRVDINIIINGGRIRRPVKTGHRGALRR